MVKSTLTPHYSNFNRESFLKVVVSVFEYDTYSSALSLMAIGAWELASRLMQSSIDSQQVRIKTYNQAFAQLLTQASNLGMACTETEKENAKNIFFVHNLIEEICYRALADVVIELGIKGDSITEEQSGYILASVKTAAHVELRKDGGYSKKGREMITPEQFSLVLENVAIIIHDRDARLTDARYSSLTDLCTAIDEHNNYVKNILFKSWFRSESLRSHTHLDMIKGLVNFNSRMTSQLGFDFGQKLETTKQYYDKYHHAKEVVCEETGEKTALKFVNITGVRTRFKDKVQQMQAYTDMTLRNYLQHHSDLSPQEMDGLFQKRSVSNVVRFGFQTTQQIEQPPLLNRDYTVGEFLEYYFPEETKPQLSALT